MNKEIDFGNDINLLVGINGSGKTSILNVVNWMLTPSLPNLCVTEFDEIILEFEYKNNKHTLKAKQTSKELLLNLTNNSRRKKYGQIQAAFLIHPREIKSDVEIKFDVIREKYRVKSCNATFSKYFHLLVDRAVL